MDAPCEGHVDRPKCNQDLTHGNKSRNYLQYHSHGPEIECAGICSVGDDIVHPPSHSKHRAASEEPLQIV